MAKRVGQNYGIRYSEAFKMAVVRELEEQDLPCEQVRRKYGIKGCIPEPVNNVVGSFCGTTKARGITTCFWAFINSKYFFLISWAVIIVIYLCYFTKSERT